MKPNQANDIVADGQKRIQESEAYQAQAHHIRVTVAAKYAEKLARAGLFERWIIQRNMEREIYDELQKLAPDHGLYLVVQRYM